MSSCLESCPFIASVNTNAAELQRTTHHLANFASGLALLLAMDEETRDNTIEMFGNFRSAALFLGDEKAQLIDVIDSVPEIAKEQYLEIEQLTHFATVSAMETTEEALEECPGQPAEFYDDDKRYLRCASEMVARLSGDVS